jgi:serine/arginine repetitive matrix protein 2
MGGLSTLVSTIRLDLLYQVSNRGIRLETCHRLPSRSVSTTPSHSSTGHQGVLESTATLQVSISTRHNPSIDSVMSDTSASAVRLGRPGLGDKMFDTSFDQGILLSSTSSPPHQSDPHSVLPPEHVKNSYNSTVDVSNEPRLSDESLFDKIGHRASLTSDTFFGNDSCAFQPRYRPLSVLSAAHPPVKEDDTWISVSYMPVFRGMTC